MRAQVAAIVEQRAKRKRAKQQQQQQQQQQHGGKQGVVDAPLKVMVSLDSEHFAGLVLKELQLYAPFATEGSYVVVQDTRLSNPRLRHPRYCAKPVFGGPCNGPAEAVRKFLAEQEEASELVFETDLSREYLRYTNHPGGYLRRVRREDLQQHAG